MIKHKAVYRGGSGEIIEKKSRFIANVKSVETVEEAQAYIEEMRKKYWDARHNCSAFSVGTERVITRCSDDGEPGGTAGKPILEVISGSGIYCCCCNKILWWNFAGNRGACKSVYRCDKSRDREFRHRREDSRKKSRSCYGVYRPWEASIFAGAK